MSPLIPSPTFKAPIREASPVKISCYPEPRPLKMQIENEENSKFVVKIKKVKIYSGNATLLHLFTKQINVHPSLWKTSSFRIVSSDT
jgi:hypothetical protein